MKWLLGCLVVVASCACSALGGECCDRCACCGCQSACTKVCRPVPATKNVTKPEYSVECEEFCVPGPSTRTHVCDECGHKKIVYTPNCGEVRTRKKLVKKDVTKKVPIIKWVVEDLCPTCAQKCDAKPAPEGQPATKPEAIERGGAAQIDPSIDAEPTALASHPTSKAPFAADIRRLLQPVLGKQ